MWISGGKSSDVREPTRLTRVLQIGLPAYFDLVWLVAWAMAMPAVSSTFATGQWYRGTLIILSLGLVTALLALLTYGSMRRWPWTFWTFLLLLGLFVALAIRGPNRTTIELFADLVSGLIAMALLIACLVALVRFGPWAMKKP